jgi:hypothetical protein
MSKIAYCNAVGNQSYKKVLHNALVIGTVSFHPLSLTSSRKAWSYYEQKNQYGNNVKVLR